MNARLIISLLSCLILLSACANSRDRRDAQRQERQASGDSRQDRSHHSQRSSNGRQTTTIQVAGVTRSFHWFIPQNRVLESRLPIVVLLHGGGGSGSTISDITQISGGFDAFAEQNGFIAIYPDALGSNWNDGRETIPHKNDDVSFVLAAIDHVSKLHSVDSRRTYIVGISNGGMMAQRIACEAPQRISAIAVVAANMPRALANNCNPSSGTPAIFFLGETDPLVPFLGGQVRGGVGGELLSATASIDFWVKKNTAAFHSSRALPDFDSRDGTTTVVEDYKSRGSTVVKFYKIAGGGHTWPGGTQYAPQRLIGTVARDFSANQAIWDFFNER